MELQNRSWTTVYCIYLYLQHLIVFEFILLDSSLNETSWKWNNETSWKYLKFYHNQAPPPHVSSSLLLMDTLETRIAGGWICLPVRLTRMSHLHNRQKVMIICTSIFKYRVFLSTVTNKSSITDTTVHSLEQFGYFSYSIHQDICI